MPSVKVRENEPFDVALRRFKRACEKAGILAEIRTSQALSDETREKLKTALDAYAKNFVAS